MEVCKADIYFAIVIVLIIYLFYKIQKSTNVKENFAVQDDVKAAINQFYNADVDAIRNLSDIATKLQAGTLTSPGNLTVNGALHVKGSNPLLFEKNGGGWHMPDAWIRSYGDKNVYCSKELRGNFIKSETDLQVGGIINCNQFSKIRSGKIITEGGVGTIIFTPPFPDGSDISISCNGMQSKGLMFHNDSSIVISVLKLDNKSCKVMATSIANNAPIKGPFAVVTAPALASVYWIAVQN